MPFRPTRRDRSPDRVAGLVLEASPTSLKDDTRLTDFVETVVSSLEDPLDPAFVRSFAVDPSSDEVSPKILDDFVDELSKVPARVWRETFDELLRCDDLADSSASAVRPC